MSLGVLNNVAAIYAENNLNATTSSLQTTLQQLSSGSKINSGADDAAGLSIVNGLGANSAALTQSSTNAAEGVGLLQVADGALSQVTSLLNRGVTLATEASNGTLTATQLSAANQEYQSILAEINNIGSTTTYNGSAVFNSTVSIYNGDSTSLGSSTDQLKISALASGTVGDAGGTISSTGSGANTYTSTAQDLSGTYTGNLVFQQGATGTPTTVNIASAANINTIAADINAANISGVSASVTQVSASAGTYQLNISEQGANLQNFTGAGADDALVSAGTATALSFTAPSGTVAGISYTAGVGGSENLSGTTLTTTPTTTLTDINTAITDIAGQRGYLGSQINTLNAAANVDSTENTNIVSAQNSISATDYGAASSNLSKEEILSQTGISALAQANSVQQEVLKLLQ